MARILVVEHGPVGSAADIVRSIQDTHPGHYIEATDPEKAPALIDREAWDAIVIDANGHPSEAASKTARIEKIAKFDPALPVIFITQDLELLSETKEIICRPWTFSSRNPAQVKRTLKALLRPEFKTYRKA